MKATNPRGIKMKKFIGAAAAASFMIIPALAPSSAIAQYISTQPGMSSKSCSAGLADKNGPAIPVTLKMVGAATRAVIDIIPMCSMSEINSRLYLSGLGPAIIGNQHLLAALHAQGIVVQRVLVAGMVGNTLHLFVEGPDHPAAPEQHVDR
jgi:hypothetical protein